MLRFISRALAFCRRVDSSEDKKEQHLKFLEGDTMLKTVQGVVTKFCRDYGFIDHLIYFSSHVVTGGVIPKVDTFCDNYHDNGLSDSCTKVSLGYITSLMEGTDCISHTVYFSVDVVCKDFEPYQGDQVEVAFSIEPDMQRRKAISVKPLRHKHVHEACITSLHGRSGVIDNSIFFTLDSLKLTDGYIPQISDIVNVVAVESI